MLKFQRHKHNLFWQLHFSSGKWSQMSTVLTLQEPTMEIQIYNWRELMYTTMKLQVFNCIYSLICILMRLYFVLYPTVLEKWQIIFQVTKWHTLIVPTDSIFFHKVKIVLLDCKYVTAPVYQPGSWYGCGQFNHITDTKTHISQYNVMKKNTIVCLVVL